MGAGSEVRVEDRVDMRWVLEGGGEGGLTVCSAGFSLIGFIIIIIVVVVIIIIIVVIVVIVIVIITIIFILIVIITYIIFFAVIIIRFLLLIMSGHGPVLTPDTICEESLVECRTGGGGGGGKEGGVGGCGV